jgi:hypothetical protein
MLIGAEASGRTQHGNCLFDDEILQLRLQNGEDVEYG